MVSVRLRKFRCRSPGDFHLNSELYPSASHSYGLLQRRTSNCCLCIFQATGCTEILQLKLFTYGATGYTYNLSKLIKYIIISQHNHLLSVMLMTATCFDSTESSSGYLRTLFKVYEVAVHIWDPK